MITAHPLLTKETLSKQPLGLYKRIPEPDFPGADSKRKFFGRYA